jgi:hypothetical protein
LRLLFAPAPSQRGPSGRAFTGAATNQNEADARRDTHQHPRGYGFALCGPFRGAAHLSSILTGLFLFLLHNHEANFFLIKIFLGALSFFIFISIAVTKVTAISTVVLLQRFVFTTEMLT